MLLSLIALIIARAAPASLTPPVPINPGKWLTADGFPVRASEPGRTGTSHIDVFDGADGKPQACQTAISSGWEDFDGQACAAAIYRGKFTPATDAAGRPMNGVYRFKVSWLRIRSPRPDPNTPDVMLAVSKLPESGPNTRVVLNYLVDETGHIAQCAVAASSGSTKFDALACRTMPTLHTFAPARDGKGKAWPVVRTQSVEFELMR